MALNPNVVVVAPNDLITSAHLNNVRSNLVRISDLADALAAADVTLGVNPAANDAATGSMADWITIGSVTVPTWARGASLVTSVNGAMAVTAVPNAHTIRVAIGNAFGQTLGRADTYRLNERINIAWPSSVNAPSAGSQLVKLQAQRTAGTGGLRADPSTLIGITIRFTP